jgi:hypothetical protein
MERDVVIKKGGRWQNTSSIVDPLMEDREQLSIGTGNSQL